MDKSCKASIPEERSQTILQSRHMLHVRMWLSLLQPSRIGREEGRTETRVKEFLQVQMSFIRAARLLYPPTGGLRRSGGGPAGLAERGRYASSNTPDPRLPSHLA